MHTLSQADAMAAVAAAAGAHALAWYLGLLALLLACERCAWSACARRDRPSVGAPVARRSLAARPGLCVALAIAAASGFAGIAYVTRHGAFAQADQAFLDAMQASVPASMVKHFKWITWFGDARTLALLCIGMAAALLERGESALALGLVAAISGNGLLNAAMKRLFERSCPGHELAGPLGHGLCFPSGHTSGAVVAYGMLIHVLMRTLPGRWHLPVLMAATALMFTVGWSRVFIEAHYPSDVVAGFAAGIAWLALGVVVTESWRRRQRLGTRLHDPARHPASAR